MTWTDATRKVAAKLEVQWDGTNWTNESVYLLTAQGDSSIQQVWQLIGGTGVTPPAAAAFTMSGASGRYSPFNTGGDLYTHIKDTHGYGAAVRFSVGYDDAGFGVYTYERVFTGVIETVQYTSTRDSRVTIRAVDASAALSQHRVSTLLTEGTTAGAYIGALATLAAVSSTDLDPGLYTIPYAWLDDEAVWTEICLLAQADGGTARFDRNGTLVFTNAETWDATNRHSFGVDRFKDLNFSSSWQNVYNRIAVVYADRVPVTSDTVFSLREGFIVLPKETYTFTATHKPAYGALTYTTTITDALGNSMGDAVTITTTPYAGRTEVSIYNDHTTIAAIVSAFSLDGQTLSGDDDHDYSLDAADSVIGNPATGAVKMFRCAGNPYVQTQAQAAFLAEMLRDRLKAARASYAVTAPGIPTLEPGSLVSVTEATTGVSRSCYVQGVTWSFGGGAFNGTYKLIDADGWAIYDNYFALSSSTLGGTHVLFY